MCVDIKCDFGPCPPATWILRRRQNRARRLAIRNLCLPVSWPSCSPPSAQVRVASDALQRPLSKSRPPQFVLNAGGDNYPALAGPDLGLWPAATLDASERGMRPFKHNKSRDGEQQQKNKMQNTRASSSPRS